MKNATTALAARSVATLSVAALLAACATTPTGPTVQVLPAPGKSFAAFQDEVTVCKHYASTQVEDQAQGANERSLGALLLGGALGAALGGAIGGGSGAGIGAAGGGVAGTALGGGQAMSGQGGIQQQYDNAYAQCMYAKGNQVAPAGYYTMPGSAVGAP